MAWDRLFSKLKQHHETHGHCYVDYTRSNRALRDWCEKLCLEYKQARLPADQVEALQALQFDFQAFGGHWRRWWLHYEELKVYVAKNKNADVPQRVHRLGPWLCAQRVQHRSGGVPENRRILLEQLGVDWAPAERLDQQWVSRFEALKKHFQEKGNLDNLSSAWISAQRTAKRKNVLPPTRVAQLESIGFKWTARA